MVAKEQKVRIKVYRLKGRARSTVYVHEDDQEIADKQFGFKGKTPKTVLLQKDGTTRSLK